MRHTRRTAALMLVAAGVAGCDGVFGIFDRRPPTLVERDGLSYQLIVSESPHYYDTYEYRLRITNTSWHTIDRWLPGACMVAPRVYRDGHWSRPVWDPCRWGCSCRYWNDVRVRLRPGDALEGWWGEVWAGDVLGGHYRGGVYHLTAVIETGHHRFEVLGLPEMWFR